MTAHPLVPVDGVTVYATSWCPYCRSLLSDLAAEGIAADVVDVDSDREAAAYVESVNRGNRVVPTVVFADGSHATNPSMRDVQRRR